MTHNPTAEQAIVLAWIDMRERCEHYHGIKDNDASVQCDHQHQRGDWCRFTECPRLREAADAFGVE
jgi:hypothetical protein